MGRSGVYWLGRVWGGRPGKRGAGADPDAVRLRAEVIREFVRGRYTEAAVTARRLVDWQRATLGEHHADHAQGLFNLARLLRKAGDDRGAARALDQVVALRRHILGSGHPETSEAERLLAELQPRTQGARRAAAGSRQRVDQSTQLPCGAAVPPVVPMASRPRNDVPWADSSDILRAAAAELEDEDSIKDLSGDPVDTTPRLDDAIARDVLDQVLDLTATGPGDHEPLRACQASAARLRARIEAGGADESELASLSAGRHPFAMLLTLVSHRDTLADAEWAAHHEAIGNTFGRPLARAVSGGRVRPAPPA